MGEVYVWIGRGSVGVERHGAYSYAEDIAVSYYHDLEEATRADFDHIWTLERKRNGSGD